MSSKLKKYRPERLKGLMLCESVIKPLEQHLYNTGLEQREEAALLAGYIIGKSTGLVTTVILPYTESNSVGCTLPMDVTAKCFELIHQTGQLVLAQVHTHPGRAWHSNTDNEWAFSDAPGLFSIVVPRFGRYGMRRILTNGVAVYERLANGDWHPLASSEIQRRILLVPNSRVIL
jgi:proteasome lid subunit RPN8/RPN11